MARRITRRIACGIAGGIARAIAGGVMMNGCTVQCARLKSGQLRWLVGPSMPKILSGMSVFSERWFLAL